LVPAGGVPVDCPFHPGRVAFSTLTGTVVLVLVHPDDSVENSKFPGTPHRSAGGVRAAAAAAGDPSNTAARSTKIPGGHGHHTRREKK